MKTIQNRTDLYEGSNQTMVAEGVYPAQLVQVRHLVGQFGRRVGLVFRISDGDYQGVEILDTAVPKATPKGKLAEMLSGLCKEIPDDLNELVGKACRIAVQHETSGRGKRYVAIARSYQ